MKKHICILFLLGLGSLSLLTAQKDDPVLFTVEDTPVRVSEFTYIYSKTNGDNADFSRQSLEQYLDLYTKFKLKVQKAKDMQLDTIEQLKKELEGYRRQLADSYLIDKEVTEKLNRELYERIQQDVDISHILFGVSGDDTNSAYQKALEIKKRLDKGADFGELATQFSDDPSAKDNKGHIGFITAMMPQGFYNVETAAYTLPIGKVSEPIRSSLGYHLLKVHGRRPARGEIEVAHILIRKKEDRDPAGEKARIDSIYQLLQNGADFDLLARDLSEDRMSARQNGYIGFFGINRYEKNFEDAAFALSEDGAISEPFQSNVGWHVVKRISKRDIQPYEVEKSRLEQKIKSDPRFEAAKESMIERIKQDNNFKEYPAVLEQFIAGQTDTLLTFRWRLPEPLPRETLFELAGQAHSLGDFMRFMKGDASRQRLSLGQTTDLNTGVQTLYESFVNAACLKYEERQLEKKYPDFRNLMREYEEGILLFEATKILVWDKASQDTTGLAAYFEENQGMYRWQERARMTLYRVSGDAKDRIDAIREYAKGREPDDVLGQFNAEGKTLIAAEEKTLERNRARMLANIPWEVGGVSDTQSTNRGSIYTFYKVEEIIPPGPKTLAEARGYVVADYQDHLEKQWVEELRQEYRVKVDKKVFNSLLKEN